MIDCSSCNGACCRWICLGKAAPTEKRWWKDYAEARGGKLDEDTGLVWIPQRCPMLIGDKIGMCKIYSNRPHVCQVFAVGSAGCLACRRLEGFNDK